MLRSPWTRAFLVWTAMLLAAAALVALDAVIGLLRADEACYFQVGPCPQAGDPDLVQLDFAFFGIPLIWLMGVLLGVVGRALARRSRTAAH
ncbi:MAG: hypothetical protein ACYDB6_11285 [Candidatus Limnocylindrales bacterium]